MALLSRCPAARRAGLAVALACLAAPAVAAENPAVAAIESAYLTKFTPFVEWPAGTDTGPSVLCILDDDGIADLLERAADKSLQTANPFVVHRLATGAAATGCRILFVGDEGGTALAAGLDEVSTAPVLTVTRAAAGRKGIVNFVIQDDRVRFEIDDAEAARHGLKISSKLLSLAVSVKPRT